MFQKNVRNLAVKRAEPIANTLSANELRNRVERAARRGHDPREACYMVPDPRGVLVPVWARSAPQARAKMQAAK